MTGPAQSVDHMEDVQAVLQLNETMPLPTLQSGQVLVQVVLCTINDEDRDHLMGHYINTNTIDMPRTLGFEGAGIVVASKIPFYMPGPKVGTRVAFYAEQSGAMAEYMVVNDPLTLIPIPDGVSYTTAAASVTNHFSVKIMADKVYRQRQHKVVLNTVPAGALGRIFTKYCTTSLGIDVIGLVRREEQKELVLADGAKYVLNTQDMDFEVQLKKLLHETNCKFAYDGLGSTMPNTLLKALPQGSTVSIYSHIASEDITFNVLNLFDKKLETFNASEEIKTLWIWQLLGVVSQIQKWMQQPEMATTIRKTFPFTEFAQAIVDSATHPKTAGKVQVIVSQSLLEE
jgi:NADPH2:quinone reductase